MSRGEEKGWNALEVGELAERGAGGDDGEAEPDAPDDPAEDRDDLVAEELRERWQCECECYMCMYTFRGEGGLLTGGKDITMRSAMGIDHPPGVLERRKKNIAKATVHD